MADPVVRDHRGEPPRKPAPTTSASGDIVRDHRTTGIQHVFVLMLENRSFDHMLGFSGITGTDALTGKPTAAIGLKGTETQIANGKTFSVSQGAANRMPHDPGHEFPDVLAQLCGTGAVYPSGGSYPVVNNSGFAAAYAKSFPNADPADVMKCYTPAQLPVLNALAREFVVCDHWFASMPGPTWPNRMFAHGGSAGGLDHSPSESEIVKWELEPGGGFEFPHGNLFGALDRANVKHRIYAGDDFPMVAGLKGISILTDIHDFGDFPGDLRSGHYDAKYTFIEPSYDVLNDYKDGTSQHPLGDVTHGEALIKTTYEAIRNSPLWDTSLLIVTWDEHGGFYDHLAAERSPHPVAPGDTQPRSEFNQYGFTFEAFGPRVPAIVVSPLIAKNLIDHRTYDHSSIPATVERLFAPQGVSLTRRDSIANGVNILARLTTARTDTPQTLPGAAVEAMAKVMARPMIGAATMARPLDSVNEGNLPAILHSAMRQDMELSQPSARPAIIARVRSIKTRAEAMEFMKEVQLKVRPRRLAMRA
jgi:phospholipase C